MTSWYSLNAFIFFLPKILKQGIGVTVCPPRCVSSEVKWVDWRVAHCGALLHGCVHVTGRLILDGWIFFWTRVFSIETLQGDYPMSSDYVCVSCKAKMWPERVTSCPSDVLDGQCMWKEAGLKPSLLIPSRKPERWSQGGTRILWQSKYQLRTKKREVHGEVRQ